jgi:hypothetical protein
MIPKINASIKTKKIKSRNAYSKLAYTYFPDPFTKILRTSPFMPAELLLAVLIYISAQMANFPLPLLIRNRTEQNTEARAPQ